MDPIERVSSREVYRNPWLKVREDDIRRPDGSPGIYGVVDRPTYALVIARDVAEGTESGGAAEGTESGGVAEGTESGGVAEGTDSGDAAEGTDSARARFRLVEQFRYPIGLRRWEFPQGTAPGGLDGDEPDGAELAARELREETGLRATSLVRLGLLDVAPGMTSQRGWVWLATGLTEGEHEREHEEQDMHSEWFSGADIEAMIVAGEITDAQTIAAWTLLRLSKR